jgi:hypothetical protein
MQSAEARKLLISFFSLPSEPSARARFACGLLPISCCDRCVWHRFSHLSQKRKSDIQFSPALFLVGGVSYEAPSQILLRCPLSLSCCAMELAPGLSLKMPSECKAFLASAASGLGDGKHTQRQEGFLQKVWPVRSCTLMLMRPRHGAR